MHLACCFEPSAAARTPLVSRRWARVVPTLGLDSAKIFRGSAGTDLESAAGSHERPNGWSHEPELTDGKTPHKDDLWRTHVLPFS